MTILLAMSNLFCPIYLRPGNAWSFVGLPGIRRLYIHISRTAYSYSKMREFNGTMWLEEFENILNFLMEYTESIFTQLQIVQGCLDFMENISTWNTRDLSKLTWLQMISYSKYTVIYTYP